jgi:hypothetical protein
MEVIMAIDFRNSYPLITWDLNKKNLFFNYFGKKDDSARGFKVQILQDSDVLIPTTESLRFYCIKDDNTKVYANSSKSDSIFIIDLPNQVFSVVGTVECELQLSDNNGDWVTSETFYIKVNENLVDGSILSSDDYIALRDTLDSVQDALINVNTAVENVNTALNDTSVAITNANAATTSATDAANLANTKATLADQKATLANEKASLADTKATLADTKAGLANTAADRANTAAQYAESAMSIVGDISLLETTTNTDLVSSINEINTNIGDKASLQTTEKSNLVSSINENVSNLAAITYSIENFPIQTPEINDTGRIQRALNAIPDGARLFFPNTYVISDNINITKSVEIIGIKGRSTIKIQNGSRIRYTLYANSISKLKVDGIIFDTNMQNTVAYQSSDYANGSYNEAIYCNGVYGIIDIVNCKFINLYNEYIVLYGCSAFVHIHDNIFKSPAQSQGLRLHDIGLQSISDSGNNIIIENNIFDHDPPTSPSYGVCAVTAEGVMTPTEIRNNRTKYAGRNNTYGHRLLAFDLYGNCRNFTIEGNICEKCQWGFVRIESSYNVVVINNKFYQDSTVDLTDPAIWVDSTSVYTQWTHDIRITGNEFFATTKVTNMIVVWTLNWDRLTSNIEIDDNSFFGYINQACIKSSCGVSGLYITRNRSFVHNTYKPNALFLLARAFDVEPTGTEASSVLERVEIKNNNWVGTVGAVFVDPSTFTGIIGKIIVNNNNFKGVRGAGEGVDIRNCPAIVTNNYLSSNAEGVGIRGSKQAYISNNIIEDCDAAMYLAMATSYIQENNLFNGVLIGEGTATIASSGTSVTVTHGLGYAPTRIVITPHGNVGSVWVNNITATQFVINCSTAPTTSVTVTYKAL